jgi:hypothetical protein
MSIPAKEIVSVLPNILAAGGNELQLTGIVLDNGSRVPLGTVPSFPDAASVGAYFGLSSKQMALATVYFKGYVGSTAKPATLGFWQYNTAPVGAWLRGGTATSLTLAQLKALSGTVIVTIDGVQHTSSAINLSAATSFSNAAELVTEGLAVTGPTQASFTGSMGASFTATASGTPATTLTVSAVTGLVSVGDTISGTGVSGTTTIASFVSGTPGGAGVYTTSIATTCSAASITSSSNVLDVTASTSGVIAVGQDVVGAATGTTIVSLGTGTGGTGTYVTTATQHLASGALTTITPICTFDSISGAFVIISATMGAASTIGYASGTLAAALFLTQYTGAVLSQGAIAAVPSASMNALTAINTDWASFMLDFDPDGGVGNAIKMAFAEWNGQQDDEFVFVCWDTDLSPTTQAPATASMGYLLSQSSISGTALIWEPTATGGNSSFYYAAFLCGAIASVNFQATNGNITFMFKGQSGLTPSVTTANVAANLKANGYNFYAEYATAAQTFIFFGPGQISGPWKWIDAYTNQIWMNAQFQLVLMTLLTAVGSIPYNAAGDAIIETSLTGTPATTNQPATGPITAAINFGAISTGEPLSSDQIEEVNIAAGLPIATTLTTKGYYLQILTAAPDVRAARGTPPCNFWYCYGGSVQQITLNSVAVQ